METLYIIKINWLAVACVTIFSFILGALWHSKLLFGNTWQAENNLVIDKSKINPLKIFGLSAISHFAGVTLLDIFIGTGFTPIMGLVKGLLISIVWISTSIGVTYLFVNRSFKIFLIDAGFYIVFYSIAGFILGIW